MEKQCVNLKLVWNIIIVQHADSFKTSKSFLKYVRKSSSCFYICYSDVTYVQWRNVSMEIIYTVYFQIYFVIGLNKAPSMSIQTTSVIS